jgi:chromosome segregation ATPase
MLSKLKVQVFELDQNKRNYQNLMAKYKQLECELAKVSDLKNRHEIALQQIDTDQRNKDILELKCKNENLFNDLNEKIATNKKLYSENNNIFHELEAKTLENQNLQDNICQQKANIRRLACDKENLERKIYSLSQLKDKQEKQINDLECQINALNNQTENQANLLNEKTNQNMKLAAELNEERNLNKNLVCELRNKENEFAQDQQKLNVDNDTIRGLKNDINVLSNLISRDKNDIATTENKLSKESAVLNQLVSDNSHLNDLIEDRNAQINSINSENAGLKKDNTAINCENNKLSNLLQAYKKHLALLINQNKKLAAEIKMLLGRDSDMRNILSRDNHLQDVRFGNDQAVNGSLEKTKQYLDDVVIQDRRGPNIDPGMISSMSQSKDPRLSNHESQLKISQGNIGEQDAGEEQEMINDDNGEEEHVEN